VFGEIYVVCARMKTSHWSTQAVVVNTVPPEMKTVLAPGAPWGVRKPEKMHKIGPRPTKEKDDHRLESSEEIWASCQNAAGLSYPKVRGGRRTGKSI
jgi:hypothetical protein